MAVCELQFTYLKEFLCNLYSLRRSVASPGFGVRGARRTRRQKAPSGVGMGRGVRSPTDYGVWGSVVSSPSRVRGGAPPTIAFSAYFSQQNASGSKKKYDFLAQSIIKIGACIKLQGGGARAPVPHAWRRHWQRYIALNMVLGLLCKL